MTQYIFMGMVSEFAHSERTKVVHADKSKLQITLGDVRQS